MRSLLAVALLIAATGCQVKTESNSAEIKNEIRKLTAKQEGMTRHLGEMKEDIRQLRSEVRQAIKANRAEETPDPANDQ